MTRAKTEKNEKAENGPISLRLSPEEKARFQEQADALKIPLSSILKIRLGATDGNALLLKTLDERLSRYESAAADMSRVALMVERVFEAVERHADQAEAWKKIDERLRDSDTWRAEARELTRRLRDFEAGLIAPADKMASAIERLSQMLNKR